MQYRVVGVHPTGLTVARGVGRCPQYDHLQEGKTYFYNIFNTALTYCGFYTQQEQKSTANE
jgi:hypothetical protein